MRLREKSRPHCGGTRHIDLRLAVFLADGTLTLEEQNGQTLVRYAGEVKVGGVIASVGQRLLDGAARMVIGQFFKNLDKQVVAK